METVRSEITCEVTVNHVLYSISRWRGAKYLLQDGWSFSVIEEVIETIAEKMKATYCSAH
jgi:hypothetical protein